MSLEKEKLPQGPTSGDFHNDCPMPTPPVKSARNTGKNAAGTKFLQESQNGKNNPDCRNT